jgi:hypothetical protein
MRVSAQRSIPLRVSGASRDEESRIVLGCGARIAIQPVLVGVCERAALSDALEELDAVRNDRTNRYARVIKDHAIDAGRIV